MHRLRIALTALLLAWVAAGCSRQDPALREAASPWVATDDGVGPVALGTSRNDLVTQGGSVYGAASECEYIRPSGAPAGVLAMVVGGTVVRIDVTRPGVPTAAGVSVGATEAAVRKAYPWIRAELPHKYVGPGHYFIVDVPDERRPPRRLIFETDGQQVTAYRVGVLPQVEWVEGCS